MSQRLQRYRIDEQIGEGAMGEVFRAYDTQTERDVAIKMLPARTLQGQRLERFKLEARTIARMEHPFVVPLYDYSLPDGDEPPFLVMRYMKGGSLADKIRQGRLHSDEVAQITRRIAAALDAAHERGLVHRDLKPGNILLDENGYSYLADFGIVKDIAADESLTQGGQPGTAHYMSPEQIMGKQIDGRSDVYALGVLAFEMLTGVQPFRGNLNTIFQAHIHEDVPRVYDYVEHLPDEVDAVLRRAMAKDPDDRFPRASHMAYELEAALQSPSAYMRVRDALESGEKAEPFEPLFAEVPSASEPPVSDTTPSLILPPTVESPQTRRWQLLAAGLGIGLLVVLTLFGLNIFNGDRGGTATPVRTQAGQTAVTAALEPIATTAVAEATPNPEFIAILQQADSAVVEVDGSLERIPESGRVPFQPPLLFQSSNEPVRLLLPNLVIAILDTNTSLIVETAPTNGGETIIRLEQGRLLVKSPTLPVRVYHEVGFQADLMAGSIGVGFDRVAEQWEVDCLEGICQVAQAGQEEPFSLDEGLYSVFSANETVATPSSARYFIFNNLESTIPQPSATPTYTSTSTTTITPTPTPSRTPTVEGDRGPEEIVLGQSVNGNEISVTRFGDGPNAVLFVGGIHSGYAPNTVALAQELIDYFSQNLTAVPPSVTLYIMPNLSPDNPTTPGLLPGRLNANGVDINRNWDCRWQQTTEILGEEVVFGGGSQIFSEPETQILKSFIEETEPAAVLFWGATGGTGRVAPGVCDGISRASVPLTQYYGQGAGYDFFTNLEVNANDDLNGDVSNWLDKIGIPAAFVLLPSFLEADLQRELGGVLSVLTAVAQPAKLQQTPTPESCTIAVNPAWATLYAENRFRLGCATSEVLRPQTVWQQFAGGRMLWRGDDDSVTVLYNNGTIDYFIVDDPALADFRVSDLIKGAIGFVHTSESWVATQLGQPVAEEMEAADVTIQDFSNGFVISWNDNGLQTNLILLQANQWQTP